MGQLHPHDRAPPAGADPYGHQHRLRAITPPWRTLLMARIEHPVRIRRIEPPLREGFQLLIELLDDAGNGTGRKSMAAQLLGNLFDLASATSLDLHLGQRAHRAFRCADSARRHVRNLAVLRHAQLDLPMRVISPACSSPSGSLPDRSCAAFAGSQ